MLVEHGILNKNKKRNFLNLAFKALRYLEVLKASYCQTIQFPNFRLWNGPWNGPTWKSHTVTWNRTYHTKKL